MRKNQNGNALVIGIGIALVAVVVIAAVVILGQPKKTPANSDACIGKTLASGATGACVTDAQNLVNWTAFGIEGSNYIKASGSYDDATATAVKTAQKNSGLSATGSIDSTTWQKMCGNVDKDAPAATRSAAKDAGC